ncbi:hypothetical protein GQ457_18G008500 [Hibiscus cannabinus]
MPISKYVHGQTKRKKGNTSTSEPDSEHRNILDVEKHQSGTFSQRPTAVNTNVSKKSTLTPAGPVHWSKSVRLGSKTGSFRFTASNWFGFDYGACTFNLARAHKLNGLSHKVDNPLIGHAMRPGKAAQHKDFLSRQQGPRHGEAPTILVATTIRTVKGDAMAASSMSVRTHRSQRQQPTITKKVQSSVVTNTTTYESQIEGERGSRTIAQGKNRRVFVNGARE